MTATVLDVGLCLLLVSAAALTVVGAKEPVPTAGRADVAAETLSVTTANVSYTLAAGARQADASVTTGGELDRVAHGTLAELFARAAFRNVTIDGDPLSNASVAYRRAVRRAVLDALPARTRVDARWEPYPRSHVRGGMTAGPTPPNDRAVDAARLTVPVSIHPSTVPDTVGTGEIEGSRTRQLAARIVRALFPPKRLQFALQDDPPLPALVRHRYRTAGRLYGVDTLDALHEGGSVAANERLRSAVAERVRTDLGTRWNGDEIESPSNRTSRVVIVVRTWSA